jgi:hypothetical protein
VRPRRRRGRRAARREAYVGDVALEGVGDGGAARGGHGDGGAARGGVSARRGWRPRGRRRRRVFGQPQQSAACFASGASVSIENSLSVSGEEGEGRRGLLYPQPLVPVGSSNRD